MRKLVAHWEAGRIPQHEYERLNRPPNPFQRTHVEHLRDIQAAVERADSVEGWLDTLEGIPAAQPEPEIDLYPEVAPRTYYGEAYDKFRLTGRSFGYRGQPAPEQPQRYRKKNRK